MEKGAAMECNTRIPGGQPLTVSPTSSPLDIGDIDNQDEITPFLKDEL